MLPFLAPATLRKIGEDFRFIIRASSRVFFGSTEFFSFLSFLSLVLFIVSFAIERVVFVIVADSLVSREHEIFWPLCGDRSCR